MIRTVLAVAVLAIGTTALVAQTDPIAARKALMKANGDQSQIATDMLEGKPPFNLDAAKKIFATFAEAGEKAPALFPDNSKTGGDTAALAGDLGEQSRFRRQARQVRDRGQSRRRGDQGRRHLQGSNHRGAQELRRLPPDLSQAGHVTI